MWDSNNLKFLKNKFTIQNVPIKFIKFFFFIFFFIHLQYKMFLLNLILITAALASFKFTIQNVPIK